VIFSFESENKEKAAIFGNDKNMERFDLKWFLAPVRHPWDRI